MWKTLQKIRNINCALGKANLIDLNQYKAKHFATLNRTKLRQFENEYKAFISLLSRSLGISPQIVREFHLSPLFNTPKSSDEKSKPQTTNTKPKDTSSSSGDGPAGGSNGNKNDNDDKMKSVLTKTIMWMFTIYMFMAFISLIMSPRSERPEGSTRYVSWNEFVHHMLATGEVKELIIRPDMEMVTIILHDGAIVKGRKVSSTIFHMAVADVSKFEEKLRDVEKRLGINDGKWQLTFKIDNEVNLKGPTGPIPGPC